jgi:hypothetical protein
VREPERVETEDARAPATAPRPAVDAPSPHGAERPANITPSLAVALQRGSGNMAVTRLLQAESRSDTHAALQRDAKAAAQAAGGGSGEQAKIDGLKAKLPQLETAKADALERRNGATQVVTEGQARVANVNMMFEDLEESYKLAYEALNWALANAAAKAQAQQDLVDIAVFTAGAALGVTGASTKMAAGVLGEAVASAGAEWAYGAAEGGVTELVGEALKPPIPSAPPSGAARMALAHWRTIADVNGALTNVALTLNGYARVETAASDCIGAIDLYALGGKGRMGLDELVAKTDDVIEADKKGEQILPKSLGLQMALMEFEGALESQLKEPSEIEQDLWIRWIASLKDEDVLDNDVLEGYLQSIGVLGAGGRLGVDFGEHFTSDDDKRQAIDRARGEVQYMQPPEMLIPDIPPGAFPQPPSET